MLTTTTKGERGWPMSASAAFQWLELLDAEVAAEARLREAEALEARFAHAVRCIAGAAVAELLVDERRS
jgi:hypothetical protein